MIINETVTIIIAIVIAYLLGSIPFAYIFTRLATGKDIRKLGSGNGGAHNVFREVGIKVAIPVCICDVAKGAAAAFIAYRLLELPLREPNIFVALAGLAAIAGHMWSVYLKFRGGNGLSATIGALAIIMPWELLIAIGCLLVLTLITRNLVLSTNLGLLSVPISAWFIDKSWLFVGFAIVIAVMLVLHFIPTARKAINKAGDKDTLTRELLRKEQK
ncbi:MAG: glycerol-3-phosphate 1-O-acyltransferase PlsY [Dehalococcoidales bacterium]|nr:glycerol-3-phosphate 1-O-acyltransferase PlsY [Dehalococcoidales bacterium]